MPETAPHLLLVTQELVAGGGERQVTHLAVGLAALGHPVTLACIGDAAGDVASLTSAGVRLVALGANARAQRARAVPRLARLARGADVVVCSGWDESLWGRLAAILARRPSIAIEHAFDRSLQTSLDGRSRASWIAWHNRLLDPFTYATVACASAQLPLLRSEGVSARKLVLIPNGVPLAQLRASVAERPLARAAIGVPDDALLIVHVARLTALKDQARTVATVRALRERLAPRDVHVCFAGDGEDRAALERATAGDPWAHVLGARDDVPALLALADLMVLPSRAEAMPMVIAEAFAVGVPVVATDVGDVGSILRGTGGGIAVALDDGDAFEEACARLLSDSAERARVAAAAGAAAADFDARAMAQRYGALARGATRAIPPADVAVASAPDDGASRVPGAQR